MNETLKFDLIQVDDEGASFWQGCVHLIFWNGAGTSFRQLDNTHIKELETHKHWPSNSVVEYMYLWSLLLSPGPLY